MIERFNFYDLYAYLVPGLALIGAMWVPFGVISSQWPSTDFVSAAGFLLAGYVAGLLLHEMASNTPWTNLDPLPSDRMLDPKEQLLRPELQNLVHDRLHSQFGLAVTAPELRNPAFRVARTRLVHDNRGSYIEQFFGLYGMTRSLSLAALLAFSWYAGWVSYALGAEATGALWTPGALWSVALALSAGLGLLGLALQLWAQLRSTAAAKARSKARSWARWLVLAWLGAFFLAGLFAADRRGVTWPQLALLWAPMLGSLAAWLIFWRTASGYAHSFAQEVYHALIATPSEKAEPKSAPKA